MESEKYIFNLDKVLDKPKEEIMSQIEEELSLIEQERNYVLPDEERQFLLRTLENEEVGKAAITLPIVLLGAFKWGFLPKECFSLKMPNFETLTNFLFACYLTFCNQRVCAENWEQIAELLDKVMKETRLPRKVLLTAQQLRIWCHVNLEESDESVDAARKFIASLRTQEAIRTTCECFMKPLITESVESLKGIGGWVDDPRIVYFVFLSEEEFEEPETASPDKETVTKSVVSLDVHVAMHKRTIEEITKNLKEIISNSVQTHENVRERLAKQYGEWIDSLENCGELLNAEFLLESLSRRSWSGVVACYCNAVEAEIKSQLIMPLKEYLASRGIIQRQEWQEIKLPSGKALPIGDKQLSIGTMQQLLEWSLNSPLIKAFWSKYSDEEISFIKTLPDRNSDLDILRIFRGDADHGKRLSRENADYVHRLVLGTPEKPGILKRLTELKKV